MNDFLRDNTLEAFANKMFADTIITSELRDKPTYNEIERQFILPSSGMISNDH